MNSPDKIAATQDSDLSEGTGLGFSPKRLARTAGFLYLLVAIFGGFAEGFLEPMMYVPGDAAATTENVVSNAGLVSLGVVSDLVNQTVLVFLGLTLYVLLGHVHRGAARAMVVLVTIAAGIASLNVVFEFAGLQVATGAVDLSSLGAEGSNGIVLLMLDTQHYGLLTAQIFFGLWLVPLGYLAHRSGWFPKPLAVLLVAAAGCYLVDVLTAFLVPDFNQLIHTFVIIPVVAIAEIWMAGHLLTIGVNTKKVVRSAEPDFSAA
jgi:hypothetical protein